MINRPIIKWIFSKAIKVTIDEKLAHESALMELMPYWKNITTPTIIVHGKDDWIVPTENVEFLNKHLVNAPLEIYNPEKMSHMMIWSEFENIKELILERL